MADYSLLLEEFTEQIHKLDEQKFETLYQEKYEKDFSQVISNEKVMKIFQTVKKNQFKYSRMNSEERYSYILTIIIQELHK